MNNENKVEPVVYLLFAGMMFFTAIVLICDKFFPNDGQVFQVMANLLAGFSGAFFMRIKTKGGTDDPAGTITKQTTLKETVTPPTPPPPDK